MSNADAHSEIIITIRGNSQSLDEAAARARAALGAMGESANTSSHRLDAHARAEHAAARGAEELAAGTRLASDAFQLFNIGGQNSYYQLMSLGGITKEMSGSMGMLRGALIGAAQSMAVLGAISFLSGAVKDAMDGEAATERLRAAAGRAGQSFEQLNRQVEDGSQQWARYGVTAAQVRDVLARGVSAGVSGGTLLGNPRALADTAALLKTDVGGALTAITTGASGAVKILTALNVPIYQQQRILQQIRYENANARASQLLGLVEHSGYAGGADAQARTAQGNFKALNAALHDLQETAGKDIVPALSDMARALAGVLTSADHLLSGFGGLGNVLRATWLPLVGLGIVLFTGLRSVVFDLAGKLIGAVAQALGLTTQHMVEASDEAHKLADDVASIPTMAETVAIFNDTAAKAEKDGVYIPDVLSIPKIAPTVATFDATAAKAAIEGAQAYAAAHPVRVPVDYIDGAFREAPVAPLTIPVRYDTANAFVEATATPIDVPVRYDTSAALTEASPAPMTVPVRYETTSALVETPPTPLVVPVSYDTVHPLVEATPTPLTVPVRYDTTNALTEERPAPLTVPVRYDTANAFHEATTTPLVVPVRYDTTRAFVEAHATAIDVPVRYDTTRAFHEATAVPLTVPVRYDTKNAFHEATATEIDVPVRYVERNTLHEAAAHPIDVPVVTHNVDQGRLDREIGQADAYAAAHPVNLPVVTHNVDEARIEREVRAAQAYATAHPVEAPVRTMGTVHVAATGATLDVTPVLDPRHATLDAAIRTTVQNEVNAGGPVKIFVTPQWVKGAGHALAGGLAMGAGVAITSAIFQSVKIDHVDGFTAPSAKAPPAPQVHVTVPAVKFPSQQHVVVDNVGAIGSAIAGGKPPPAAPVSSSHGAPPLPQTGNAVNVRVMNAYDIGSAGNPIHLSATTPINATINTTKPFAVSQSGGWKVSIGSIDWGALAEMAVAMAAGSLATQGIMGLLSKGGPAIWGYLSKLLGDIKGPRDGPGSGGGGGGNAPDVPLLGPAQMADLENFIGRDVIPANRALVPAGHFDSSVLAADLNNAFKAPDVVGSVSAGVAGLFRSLDWTAHMAGKTASMGLQIAGSLTGGVVVAFRSIDWGKAAGAIGGFAAATAGIALAIGGVLLGALKAVGSLLGGGAAGAAPAMISLRTNLISSFSGVIAGIASGVAGSMVALKTAGANAINSLISGIQGASARLTGTVGKGFDVALNIVVQLANGVKASAGLLIQAGKDMITGFINGMINLVNQALSHFPGGLSVPLLSTSPPPKPPPVTHHGAPTSAGGHGASLIYVSPQLAASLRGAASSGAGLAQQHTHTHRETHTHQNTIHAPITINGAQHPEAIGHQITQALLDMERGVAEAARKGGGGSHGR